MVLLLLDDIMNAMLWTSEVPFCSATSLRGKGVGVGGVLYPRVPIRHRRRGDSFIAGEQDCFLKLFTSYGAPKLEATGSGR